METLKRYSMALLFLSLVILLMIVATLLVKNFGDKMLENTDLKIRPVGERVN